MPYGSKGVLGGLVAPHVGAWIEIDSYVEFVATGLVAPHVGAWIEIDSYVEFVATGLVAPHVGAWIEIKVVDKDSGAIYCRTPRGCVD